MAKFHELLNKAKPISGDIGIEIEYEGAGFKEVKTSLWKTEDDGSLRGLYPIGRGEYILQKPIPIDTVAFSLNELKVAIKDAIPNFSFRTSVHLHVNVQDMAEEQVQNFIYASHLLEEPLAHFCGNTRKGNRFCLRTQDADGTVNVLKSVFRKGMKEIFRFHENQIRYAFINLASLKKYGSIEFRGMRGTLDVDVLNTWATALVSIRNYSCHHKNCLAIHDEFVTKGPIGFLEHVLGELAKQFIYKKCEQDMQLSYSLLYEIPYEFKYGQVDKPEEAKKIMKNPAVKYVDFPDPNQFLNERVVEQLNEAVINQEGMVQKRNQRRVGAFVNFDPIPAPALRNEEVNDE